eukprot:gene9465-32452_t
MQAGARDDQDGATNAGTQSDAQDPPRMLNLLNPPSLRMPLPTGTPPPPTIPSETSEAMAPSPKPSAKLYSRPWGLALMSSAQLKAVAGL